MFGLPDFELQQILSHFVYLAIAFALALPVGWDRERSERDIGLRTFPLVAMASCGFILVAEQIIGDDPQANARVIQGLMTGIGFLGGGAIVKRGLDVRGTATAASVWTTAAVGAAVAYGRWDIGLALSIVTFATLRWLRPVEKKMGTHPETEEDESDREGG